MSDSSTVGGMWPDRPEDTGTRIEGLLSVTGEPSLDEWRRLEALRAAATMDGVVSAEQVIADAREFEKYLRSGSDE